MRILLFLLALGAFSSCEKAECVDCADTEGNVFTFCEPAESPIENLECGETYKTRK
ncbi:MAG: hypothetical protein RLP15_01040 [Cryomorphaceae bacterium]